MDKIKLGDHLDEARRIERELKEKRMHDSYKKKIEKWIFSPCL